MRIGVDARALAVPPAGIAVYTRSLLRGFAELERGHRFLLYSTRDFDLPGPGPFEKRVGRGALAKKGSIWMQAAVPALCVDDGVDLFWSPLQTLPVALPGSIPAVLTIHDFVQLVFPGSMAFANWLTLKALAPPSWRRADAFLTGSKYSEMLIRRYLGPGRRVKVAPYGPMTLERRPSAEEGRTFARRALGVEGPYLLSVGTLEPRKNLTSLFRALVILSGSGSAIEHRLVVAGARGWKDKEIFQAARGLGLEQRVVFAGRVADADLARLYAGADLFVFPSLYEGFGLPVLEAMALGVPVACSRSSSLPEIAGDAALLFNPREPEDIARTIREAIGDRALRARLGRDGEKRAARFSWDRAAAESLAFIEDIAASFSEKARRREKLPDFSAEALHFDRMSLRYGAGATPDAMRVTEPTSYESSIVRDAFDHLGELRGRRFLDFGCGWGHNAVFAAARGASTAVGFDVARASIRVARAKAEANGVSGSAFFVVARAERLPFRAESFDLVAGNGILHHAAIGMASRELDRVLAPGGRAAFTEPLGRNPAAQAVRGFVPYPRKCRTLQERPLKEADLRLIRTALPGVELRPYYFLTSIMRLIKGWFPRGRLDRLDRRLLESMPWLGPLAAQVLILAEKPAGRR